jgi:agmatinase
VLGLKLTNNSPFRRVQELPFVKTIITVGVRGVKSTDRELRETRERGNLVFTNYEVFDQGPSGILDRLPGELGNYYVSIDIDALDPSIAPGTESPEAEGLSYTQVKRILQGIAQRGTMVGLDLVEVNPYLDHAELTQHIAAQLLIEGVATAFTGA